MKVKWGNILTLGILAFLVMLVVLFLKIIRGIDGMYYSINLPYYFNDPVYGLMFLGLICITIVAVVKILIRK